MCGASNSLYEIVLFRFLQGAFGASFAPLSQSLMMDSYPREKFGQVMALTGIGIMIGPVIGPTLGGFLTEYSSWRWVFYVNLPIGIISFLGIVFFSQEKRMERGRPFDLIGFATLAIAVAAIQMMFDRGTSKDWFESVEIIAEATIAALCLYLFVVQLLTAKRPFLEIGIFKDRYYVTSLVFIFFVGVLMLATMALLPLFLQGLIGYPVIKTGIILAPRGVGMLLSMLVVGRIVGKVDVRYLVGGGLLLTSFALWQMTHFTMDVTVGDILSTGFMQGFGIGIVFVPLSTVAYTTLEPHLRTEAAALFHLVRNVGSSIGVSIVMGLLGWSVQQNHASLAENISVLDPIYHSKAMPFLWSLDTPLGLLALDGAVNQQALMIGYTNDFKLIMWMSLVSLPFVIFLGSGIARTDEATTGKLTSPSPAN